jgi:hypothetical protein
MRCKWEEPGRDEAGLTSADELGRVPFDKSALRSRVGSLSVRPA